MAVSFDLGNMLVLAIDDTSLMRVHHKNNLIAMGIKENNIHLPAQRQVNEGA